MKDQPGHKASIREQVRLIAIFYGLFLTPYFIYSRIDHRMPVIVDILSFPVLIAYGWLLVRKKFAGEQFRNPDDEQYDVRGNGVLRAIVFMSMIGMF